MHRHDGRPLIIFRADDDDGVCEYHDYLDGLAISSIIALSDSNTELYRWPRNAVAKRGV